MKALLLILFLTMGASAQTARVLETLDDGSYIMDIDGHKFRALPASKIVEFAQCKSDVIELKIQNARLEENVKLEKTNVAHAQETANLFKGRFEEARADARNYLGLAAQMDQLLIQSREFFPVAGKPKGIVGFLLKVANSPLTRAGFQFVQPTIQTWRAFQRN